MNKNTELNAELASEQTLSARPNVSVPDWAVLAEDLPDHDGTRAGLLKHSGEWRGGDVKVRTEENFAYNNTGVVYEHTIEMYTTDFDGYITLEDALALAEGIAASAAEIRAGRALRGL